MNAQSSRSQRKTEAKEKDAMVQQSPPMDIPDRQPRSEELRRQIYLDEHNQLVAGEEASIDQFDKNILTLAAGAVAISLVFLEKIAPHSHQSTLVYIGLAWIGLVTSLLSTLFSFLTSQHAFRRQRAINDDLLFSPPSPLYTKKANQWARITTCLNWISILAFIFGLSMLAWFGITNMQRKLAAQESNTLTTGTMNGGTNGPAHP